MAGNIIMVFVHSAKSLNKYMSVFSTSILHSYKTSPLNVR